MAYQKSVLYAARLTKDKGLENYMNLAAKMPGITFYIAGGSGELTEKVKEMEAKHSNLKYLGSLPRKDLFAKFQEVDYLMLPSIWYENNPMIIIEAMAFGLPVIGSRMGGIPELLEDGRGFLFDPYTEGDDLRLLTELADLPIEEYRNVARKARAFAQQLSFDHYYEKLARVLPQLKVTAHQTIQSSTLNIHH
ncbi:MAG: glycosyltransferase family 4 protein [Chitinophagaceae bacterium]|nr:glycosyltransferase family 4 protein [Chitinophagaceae bacterium]